MDGRTGGCIEFVLPRFFHFGSSVLHRAPRAHTGSQIGPTSGRPPGTENDTNDTNDTNDSNDCFVEIFSFWFFRFASGPA